MVATELKAGIPMTFRDVLKVILVKKDISLLELAKRAGVSYQTLKGWSAKSAKRKPSVPHLIAICRVLEISLDEFRECDDFQLEKEEGEGADGDSDNS